MKKKILLFLAVILLVTATATIKAQDIHLKGGQTAVTAWDPTWFLGVGQGDTVSAINYAIQLAAASGLPGAKVKLPAGNWGIKNSYLSGSAYRPVGIIGASNVTLEGDGIGKTIIVQDAPPGGATFDTATFISNAHFSSIIRCTNCTNFIVQNLSVDGTLSRQINHSTNPYTNPQDGNAADSSQSDGIYFNGGSNNTAYNVRLDSVQGYGFRASGAYQSIFDHIIATTAINGGVYFAGIVNGSILSNSLITNTYCDNVRTRSGKISIINNEISWSKFNNRGGTNANFAGFYVEDDGGTTPVTNSINVTGNRIHDNSSYGLDLTTIDTVDYTFIGPSILVDHNQIYNNAAGGIQAHIPWMSVTSNTIWDNGVDSLGIVDPEGASGRGIFAHGNTSNGLYVNGNTFRSTASVGKQLYAFQDISVGTIPIFTFTNNQQSGGLDLIDVTSFGLNSSPYNVVYGNSVLDSTRAFRADISQDASGGMHWAPRQPGLSGARTGTVYLEGDNDAYLLGSHLNNALRGFYVGDVFGTVGGSAGMGLYFNEAGAYTNVGGGGVIGARNMTFYDFQAAAKYGAVNAQGELIWGTGVGSNLWSMWIHQPGTSYSSYNSPNNFQTSGALSSGGAFETALLSSFNPGYTGNLGYTLGGWFTNTNIGGTGSLAASSGERGNFGAGAAAYGANTGSLGTNVGLWGVAYGSLRNVGGVFDAAYSLQYNNASAISGGVIGYAHRTNASAINFGGYFGLDSASEPTFASAALIADNAAESVPVLLARVNGVTKFQVDASGNADPGATNTTDLGTSSLLWRNLYAKGIVGTTTNDNASSGNVGEYVTSSVAIGSPVGLSTTIAANVTSISLTAGDWDVEGIVSFTESSSTVTARSAGINSTTATVPNDGSEGYNSVQSVTTSETNSITVTRKRISLTTTTTIYLVGQATFTAGSVGGFGTISARRVR